MEESEKKFIEYLAEHGIKLPDLSIDKNDDVTANLKSPFINDLTIRQEERSNYEEEINVFKSSLVIDNYLDAGLIERFISVELREKNLFAGRNVSDYEWYPANQEMKSLFSNTFETVDDHLKIQTETTTQIDFKLLSWYKNVFLIRVSDATWSDPEISLYYLLHGSETFYRLDGTSPPIHEINVKCPVEINQFNAISYLMYFCFFVRGEEGPFYIMESLDDSFVPKNDTTNELIKSISHKASIPVPSQKDGWYTRVVVFYSNAIFEAQFDIQSTGMIEMLDDDPIVNDLPISLKKPIAYSEG